MHVTAAGVYEHVLKELIPVFEQERGVSVQLTVANAAGVIKRLEAREAVDVVLTSAAGIDHLIAGGLADRASSVEIGRMRLGVGVAPGLPKPDLSTADAVRSLLLAAPHVAYIDPKGGGTSGPFIANLFERLGVADQMNQSGVLAKTGRDVVRAVASGEATCGLTQAERAHWSRRNTVRRLHSGRTAGDQRVRGGRRRSGAGSRSCDGLHSFPENARERRMFPRLGLGCRLRGIERAASRIEAPA